MFPSGSVLLRSSPFLETYRNKTDLSFKNESFFCFVLVIKNKRKLKGKVYNNYALIQICDLCDTKLTLLISNCPMNHFLLVLLKLHMNTNRRTLMYSCLHTAQEEKY